MDSKQEIFVFCYNFKETSNSDLSDSRFIYIVHPHGRDVVGILVVELGC